MCMHTFVSVLQVFGHVFVGLVHIVCVRKRERERERERETGGREERWRKLHVYCVCMCVCVLVFKTVCVSVWCVHPLTCDLCSSLVGRVVQFICP